LIPDGIQQTSIWARTLSAFDADKHVGHRERLRVALDQMRENVIPLVRDIHRDVLGLTVHDESHLDALWQTADVIAGPDFVLTPAEAFVFGAAVLLHDTAMAIASYPGGLHALKATIEWQDSEAAYKQAAETGESKPLPVADQEQ
jgi:hypothetical protein